MNHNHNGYNWAASRYAQDFLDGIQEHQLARRLLGLANTAPTEDQEAGEVRVSASADRYIAALRESGYDGKNRKLINYTALLRVQRTWVIVCPT